MSAPLSLLSFSACPRLEVHGSYEMKILFFKGGEKSVSVFLYKPSSFTKGPIPSHVLKDFTHLQPMPVFQVLFTEKLFKGAAQAHGHLIISSLSL